jgi:hypothetical protein
MMYFSASTCTIEYVERCKSGVGVHLQTEEKNA